MATTEGGTAPRAGSTAMRAFSTQEADAAIGTLFAQVGGISDLHTHKRFGSRLAPLRRAIKTGGAVLVDLVASASHSPTVFIVTGQQPMSSMSVAMTRVTVGVVMGPLAGVAGDEMREEQIVTCSFTVDVEGYDVGKSGYFVRVAANMDGTRLALYAAKCCAVFNVPITRHMGRPRLEGSLVHCQLIADDAEDDAAHPPLIMKAEWHPFSPGHLVVLRVSNYPPESSTPPDATFATYNVTESAVDAELQLELPATCEAPSGEEQGAGRPRMCSLGVLGVHVPYDPSADLPVDFTFMRDEGPLWHQLAAMIVTQKGRLFAITPLLPRQCRLPMGVFDDMLSMVGSPDLMPPAGDGEGQGEDMVGAEERSMVHRWLDEVLRDVKRSNNGEEDHVILEYSFGAYKPRVQEISVSAAKGAAYVPPAEVRPPQYSAVAVITDFPALSIALGRAGGNVDLVQVTGAIPPLLTHTEKLDSDAVVSGGLEGRIFETVSLGSAVFASAPVTFVNHVLPGSAPGVIARTAQMVCHVSFYWLKWLQDTYSEIADDPSQAPPTLPSFHRPPPDLIDTRRVAVHHLARVTTSHPHSTIFGLIFDRTPPALSTGRIRRFEDMTRLGVLCEVWVEGEAGIMPNMRKVSGTSELIRDMVIGSGSGSGRGVREVGERYSADRPRERERGDGDEEEDEQGALLRHYLRARGLLRRGPVFGSPPDTDDMHELGRWLVESLRHGAGSFVDSHLEHRQAIKVLAEAIPDRFQENINRNDRAKAQNDTAHAQLQALCNKFRDIQTAHAELQSKFESLRARVQSRIDSRVLDALSLQMGAGVMAQLAEAKQLLARHKRSVSTYTTPDDSMNAVRVLEESLDNVSQRANKLLKAIDDVSRKAYTRPDRETQPA